MDTDPAQMAEALQARLQPLGIVLPYDRNGVAQLAYYLDQNREAVRLEETTWVGLAGAFLGECLRRNFGGRWQAATPQTPRCVVLGSADKAVFPDERVSRHLRHGPAESILALYDAVAADKTGGAIGHGSNWGVNTGAVCCPKCGEPQPSVRIPKSFKEMLWGGWTCKGCGCAMDKWGRERKPKGK